MSLSRFIATFLFFSVCALAGCASLKDVSQLPPEYQIRELAKADKDTPLAVSRSGALAAVSGNAIEIVAPDGKADVIAPGAASAISFSPSGDRIAAALPTEKGCILRLLDQKGKVLGETTLRQKVTSLGWTSESQLLATALDLKKYSFGTLLTSLLYTWDGANPPAVTKLSDVTVWPTLAKLGEPVLLGTLSMAVSPYRDEIAYTELRDPPMFSPYLRIVTRHLESGAVNEVGKASLGSGGPLYTPDGESLLIGDTRAVTRRVSVLDGKEMDGWPAPGSYPAISPSGAYVFLDGRVYHDGKRVASFPREARVAFVPDGSGLVVSYEGKVYQVTGLKDDQPASPPKDLKWLLQLRRLKSLGLITPAEYREQKAKGPAQ